MEFKTQTQINESLKHETFDDENMKAPTKEKKKRGAHKKALWRYTVDEEGREKYNTHRLDRDADREYMKKYYREKMVGSFTCCFCDQVVGTLTNLRRHQRTVPVCLLKQEIKALQCQLAASKLEGLQATETDSGTSSS